MTSPVQLPSLLRRVNDSVDVPIEIVLDFPEDRLVEIEYRWRPERKRLPPTAEHRHWNWDNKTGTKKYRLVAIMNADTCEGLLAVNTKLRSSRTDQHPLLYIGYIESAPWNLEEYPDGQRFRGVGTSLMIGAILISRQTDAKGGVCLHSLNQTVSTYQNKWQMTSFGRDEYLEDLTYFEFTPQEATDFLTKRTRS